MTTYWRLLCHVLIIILLLFMFPSENKMPVNIQLLHQAVICRKPRSLYKFQYNAFAEGGREQGQGSLPRNPCNYCCLFAICTASTAWTVCPLTCRLHRSNYSSCSLAKKTVLYYLLIEREGKDEKDRLPFYQICGDRCCADSNHSVLRLADFIWILCPDCFLLG